MDKSELRTGMLVELRNGELHLFMNHMFVDFNGYIGIEEYTDDLRYGKLAHRYDVMKVWDIEVSTLDLKDESMHYHPCWEREEEVE